MRYELRRSFFRMQIDYSEQIVTKFAIHDENRARYYVENLNRNIS